MAEIKPEINLEKQQPQTDGSENIQIENKTYNNEEVKEMAEGMWESHIKSQPSLKKLVDSLQGLDKGSELGLTLLKRGFFDRALIEGVDPYLSAAANEVLPSLNQKIDELMQEDQEIL